MLRLKQRIGAWVDRLALGGREPPGRAGAESRLPGALRDLLATHETRRPYTGVERRRPGRRTGGALPRGSEPRTLFGEILDWMMVPLLLLWPMSVLITFFAARTIADAPFDRALRENVLALAREVRFIDNEPVVVLGSDGRAVLGDDEDDPRWFQFVAADDTVLLGETTLPAPPLYDFSEPSMVHLRSTTFRDEDVRIAYLYVVPTATSGVGPPVLVQLAEPQAKRARLANEIIKGVIMPQFLILPLALALVWFGLSRGLGPIKSLQRGIHDRRPDDLSPIDHSEVPQELTPLVDAFNELLERLAQSVTVQKRFIADAAHQMKTPLAGLRTQAELALRQDDEVELRRSLLQLARGSQRAAHLVNQLLSMARAENLGEHPAFERLDLRTVARDAAGEWVGQAVREGIDFGVEFGQRPAWILGHSFALREMISNLIDNALRYTPGGGHVTVRVGSSEMEVTIEFEDDGPGIAAEERERVFERFYRVLGSRADGSGLGLAIVKEIAQLHGATIELMDTNPGADRPGTRMRIRFPAMAGPF